MSAYYRDTDILLCTHIGASRIEPVSGATLPLCISPERLKQQTVRIRHEESKKQKANIGNIYFGCKKARGEWMFCTDCPDEFAYSESCPQQKYLDTDEE